MSSLLLKTLLVARSPPDDLSTLSHSTPSWPFRIISAASAQSLVAGDEGLDPEPEPPEPEHFARSRDISIGAGAGMLPRVRGSRRSCAKFSRIQVFGAEPVATGAGLISRSRSYRRNHRDIKLGARPRAREGMLPWSRSRSRSKLSSLLLAMQCHYCGLDSSWPPGALPAARQPPIQSVLSGAARTVSSAWGKWEALPANVERCRTKVSFKKQARSVFRYGEVENGTGC